jgi:type IV pilus assembly protein PilM
MLPVLFFTRTTVLNCGAERTTLAVFRRSGNRLCLENYADELHPLADENGDRWLENTGSALHALRKKVKIRGPVTLTLPAHLVFTKLVKVPRVASARLAKVVTFEAEQNIPYALADVVWDSTVVGENGSTLEILLAAAKLEAVEPLCASARAAGFEPRTVLPSALGTLAAFRLVHASPVKPSLVLNLGAHSATLLLVERSRFSVRSFRLGADHDLRQTANEQISRATGTEATKPFDAAQDEPYARRLAHEVMRSVLHFRRQNGGENPGTLFLTGVGAQMSGLTEILSTKLVIRVELLDFASAVESTSGAIVEDPANLADVVGAAAIQLRPNQPVLNLLPFRLRQRETSRQRWPWLAAAAVLALATPVPAWIHFYRVAVETGKKTAGIERELAPVQLRPAPR